MSRRRIPPTTRLTLPTQNASLNNETEPPIIKHIQFIQSQNSPKNELVNEFIIMIFTAIAASSQFVHLYRSVWWFADSYTNYTVVRKTNFSDKRVFYRFLTTFQNFYLIDVSLVVFIFVMIGRRFLYCLLVKALEVSCPEKHLAIAEKILKYSFLGLLEVTFLICNIKIFQNYNIVYIFYLIYP